MTGLAARRGSSGDAIADRRFAYARDYAAGEEHAAAAELCAQAVEIVPGWAPGWLLLGELRLKAGDPGGAAEAFARCRALDAEDALGAGLALAVVARRAGRAHRAPEMTPAFVRALFDGYAESFDAHLIETLGYRAPALLAAALAGVAQGRIFASGLDLGCGTGLMAAALPGRVARLEGVDLSPEMLKKAGATGRYAALHDAELVEHLRAAAPGAFDLLLAADVLVYLGDLRALFAAARAALVPGGLFAFTTQTHADGHESGHAGGEGIMLGADRRFSHSEAYLRTTLAAAGFVPRHLARDWTRRDGGIELPSLVVVAEAV